MQPFFIFRERNMGKFNINFNFSWIDFLKHVLRIVLTILVIIAFNKYFPQNILPKDFIFKTAVYACFYVLVSLILEIIFKKFERK